MWTELHVVNLTVRVMPGRQNIVADQMSLYCQIFQRICSFFFGCLRRSGRSMGDQWQICSLSIYIPWPFPLVWGVADNTKETTKTMGISLRSSSNDEGPSRVWMALLEQHSPSSPRLPQLMSLHRCHLPCCPYHRVASIRQPRGSRRNRKLPIYISSVPDTMSWKEDTFQNPWDHQEVYAFPCSPQ